MFDRWYAEQLREKLKRPFVHWMFGARQTGKSTLLNTMLPDNVLRIDLSDPAERTRHLSDPGEFIKLCRALPPQKKGHIVFVDEIQSVLRFSMPCNIYQRSRDGGEVDFIIEQGRSLLPIEMKWTETLRYQTRGIC